MKSSLRFTVQVRLKFSSRNLTPRVLEKMGRDRAVPVNIIRGQITQEDASIKLEVTGNPRSIETLVRLSTTWGASLDPLPVGVA